MTREQWNYEVCAHVGNQRVGQYRRLLLRLRVKIRKHALEHRVRALIKEPESHLLDVRVIVQGDAGGAKCDSRGLLQRIAVHSGRYRRKRNAPAAMRGSQLNCAPVAGRQQLSLTGRSSTPNGSHGVNDVLRVSESSSARDLCVTCRAATVQTTLLEELRASGAMNGTIDASASQQTRVGGVDDHVGIRVRRDVTQVKCDVRHGPLM
jgi:hypothetical protein